MHSTVPAFVIFRLGQNVRKARQVPTHTNKRFIGMNKQTSGKRRQLLQLAKQRQTARWRGYRGIRSYYNGAYECDHVSPYTKSAKNVDAEVFVMLQDWSSHEGISKGFDPDVKRLGHTPALATNRNLIRLLSDIFGLQLHETYATNLFPFIKQGSMNARIPTKDLCRAAQLFATPQIEIVRPKLVICLGLQTFNALQRVHGQPPSQSLDVALASSFIIGNSIVWCQAHTGGLGQATRNRGGVNRVGKDWKRMRKSIAKW